MFKTKRIYRIFVVFSCVFALLLQVGCKSDNTGESFSDSSNTLIDIENTQNKTNYDKEIYSSEYVSIICNSINKDKIEFSVSSKLNNNSISVLIDRVALDGKVPIEKYNENCWIEVEPGTTAIAEFGADINYTDHHYLTACISVYSNNKEIENIDIINFNLGGNVNEEYDEPKGKLVYDSSALGITFCGADEKGIRLRINNKMEKSANIAFEKQFTVNNKEYDEFVTAMTIPALSISDYYFDIYEFNPDFNSDDIEKFECSGKVYDNKEIENFEIDSSKEIVSYTEPETNSEITESSKERVDETETNQTSAVYDAYIEASTLTRGDLTITDSGRHEYNDLCLSDRDDEWVNSSRNKSGTVEAGALYRSIAAILEGFYELKMIYGSWAVNTFPLIFGIEKPDTWEECKKYVDNASTFITNEDSWMSILKKIEQLSCVEGNFDFKNYEFNFKINDLSLAAEEMGITETMLGYSLARLKELAPETKFVGNTYSFSLSLDF